MSDCDCRDWYAVHDHQGPPTVRVQGTCAVATEGTMVHLRVHEPQGINPADLLLDLEVTEPDIGLPRVVDVSVLFELETTTEYATVSVIGCEVGIEVHDVH